MKIKMIRAIKVFVFLSLFTLSYIFCNSLFMTKGYGQTNLLNAQITKNQKAKLINGFYEKEENTLDVVFIGSSHVFCDINPNVIWNSYGITSYDFASTSQDIYTSYYFLKEVFTKQQPKVIFIDLLFKDDEFLLWKPLDIHSATDLMPTNRNKFDFVVNRIYKEHWSSVFNPLERYHTRWKELTIDDFTYFGESKHDNFNGHYAFTTTKKWVQPEINKVEDIELNTDLIKILEEIINLCKKNNCELVFTSLPSIVKEKDLAKINAYEAYFESVEVKYLNINEYFSQIGLSTERDFLDKVHLNYRGAEKLSNYLGGYIKDNYNISDKRLDDNYEIWNKDFQLYDKLKKEFENNAKQGE